MPSLVAVVGDIQKGRTGGEQYDAKLVQAAQDAGLKVVHLNWHHSLDKWLAYPVVWRFQGLLRTCVLTWQLWRTSGDVLIDIWAAPYLIFWAKRTRRHIVLMVHHLRGELEKNPAVQHAEQVLIQAASQILTVSQSSKRQIQALRKGDVPMAIIPPGFERPKVKSLTSKAIHKQAATPDIHFLFVGHITQVKGVLDVIIAASKLQVGNWKLHIVGGASAEPDTWTQAQSLIQAQGLQSKITLYGRVEDEKLAALYASSDVFVLPSYWEGYGIVFLEAMSLGLPVIATTAGAIPEVVTHHKTGLLVEAGDVPALAQAMQTLIEDADKRQLFAHHAKQHAEQAEDWQAIQQRMQTWWEKFYA